MAEIVASCEGVPLLIEELLTGPGVPLSLADSVLARLAKPLNGLSSVRLRF